MAGCMTNSARLFAACLLLVVAPASPIKSITSTYKRSAASAELPLDYHGSGNATALHVHASVQQVHLTIAHQAGDIYAAVDWATLPPAINGVAASLRATGCKVGSPCHAHIPGGVGEGGILAGVNRD